jgi:hypothetical protein
LERALKFSLKYILMAFLVGLAGCGRQPAVETDLSEQQFVDIFADVFAVSVRYADAPDSLLVHREAVFREHGVTRDQVERFLAARRDQPAAWASVMAQIRDRLGDEMAPQPSALSNLPSVRDSMAAHKKNGQQP